MFQIVLETMRFGPSAQSMGVGPSRKLTLVRLGNGSVSEMHFGPSRQYTLVRLGSLVCLDNTLWYVEAMNLCSSRQCIFVRLDNAFLSV